MHASKVVSNFYFFKQLANTWLIFVYIWLHSKRYYLLPICTTFRYILRTNGVKWQQMAMCVRYTFVDIWT